MKVLIIKYITMQANLCPSLAFNLSMLTIQRIGQLRVRKGCLKYYTDPFFKQLPNVELF